MPTLFDPQAMQELKRRIASLSPDHKAEWGKMNAGQMLCHANDGFRMACGELEVEDKSNLISRTLLKFLVLNLINIPKDVPTAKELDQMQMGTPPAEFEADRERLIASLEKMEKLPEDHKWANHVRFGPMKRQDWGEMGYKHLDHHLRQFGV